MRPLFRLFFQTLRLVLTPILLFTDWITTPRGVVRSEAEQSAIDAQSRGLALYQFKSCPFCIKTRRAIKRLSLPIELRDAQHDATHRDALLQGGGEIKVPCLRITEEDGTVRWLYESSDIIDYLEGRFGAHGELTQGA